MRVVVPLLSVHERGADDQARPLHVPDGRGGHTFSRQRSPDRHLAWLGRVALGAREPGAGAGGRRIRRRHARPSGRQLQRSWHAGARELEATAGGGVAHGRRARQGPALSPAARAGQGQHVRHVGRRPHGAEPRERPLVAGAVHPALRIGHQGRFPGLRRPCHAPTRQLPRRAEDDARALGDPQPIQRCNVADSHRLTARSATCSTILPASTGPRRLRSTAKSPPSSRSTCSASRSTRTSSRPSR